MMQTIFGTLAFANANRPPLSSGRAVIGRSFRVRACPRAAVRAAAAAALLWHRFDLPDWRHRSSGDLAHRTLVRSRAATQKAPLASLRPNPATPHEPTRTGPDARTRPSWQHGPDSRARDLAARLRESFLEARPWAAPNPPSDREFRPAPRRWRHSPAASHISSPGRKAAWPRVPPRSSPPRHAPCAPKTQMAWP